MTKTVYVKDPFERPLDVAFAHAHSLPVGTILILRYPRSSLNAKGLKYRYRVENIGGLVGVTNMNQWRGSYQSRR